MEESIYLSTLYDYYKDLLTDKQKSYFEDYYFDNLTIMEIAENNNISKNAVSKSLLEIKEKLFFYESILKLNSNKEKIKNILNVDEFSKIVEYI